MAASQRQLQWYIHFKSYHGYTYFYKCYRNVMLKKNKFSCFCSSKPSGKKYKHTELALNFAQKQYFSQRNTFSLYFSQIVKPWSSKKLFWKFSFFEGTLTPHDKKAFRKKPFPASKYAC